MRHVEAAAFAALCDLGAAVRALAGDRTRRLRRRRQCRQADVVRVSECSFFTGERPHADALVDIKAAGLDDAFLETPALAAAVLKIQIGVVDFMRENLSEDLRKRAVVERIRCQQSGLCGLISRIDGRAGNAGIRHVFFRCNN